MVKVKNNNVCVQDGVINLDIDVCKHEVEAEVVDSEDNDEIEIEVVKNKRKKNKKNKVQRITRSMNKTNRSDLVREGSYLLSTLGNISLKVNEPVKFKDSWEHQNPCEQEK